MQRNIEFDERVLPSPELVGDAVLSLLESRAILFRANKALPAFYLAMKKSGGKKQNSLNGRTNMKTTSRGVTFHFCRARYFFIFSFDRFLVDSAPESNAAIQGWASACSQFILLLAIIQVADIQLGTKGNNSRQRHWLNAYNYLVSLISKELMKSWAFCVISSKLSSLNSHCAAVTKARVSASVSPWKGDSPLSLQRGGRFHYNVVCAHATRGRWSSV